MNIYIFRAMQISSVLWRLNVDSNDPNDIQQSGYKENYQF